MEEIQGIGIDSSERNRLSNITGLLVYFEKLFFQIIEGGNQEIDQLFERIKKDSRHSDILILKTENDIEERLFPGWSMKTMNLDSNMDELIRPVKILLQSLVESHSIIEQYTSPAVLRILNEGINPLSVPPVPIEKIILFTDIISYSTISEKMSIKNVLLILNTYFDVCSTIISERGGEINKFLGDGLMAYFEVEKTDNAIESCLDILEKLKKIRDEVPEKSPLKLLYAGFGLARGLVIEGNMGSRVKKDYTIIGDAVNTASRIEKLTRILKRTILLSKPVMNSSKKPWKFVSLGKYNLRGKEKDRQVYTIDNDLVLEYNKKLKLP
jgi:class 3 adenylate cyclase